MIDDVDVSSVHFIGFHSTPGCRKKVVEEVERRVWAERDGLSERMMMMMVMVIVTMMMVTMMMMRIEEYGDGNNHLPPIVFTLKRLI